MSKTTKLAALLVGAAAILAAGAAPAPGIAHAAAASNGGAGFILPPVGATVQLAVQPAQPGRHVFVGEAVALTAVPPAPVGLVTGAAAGSLPETQIWLETPSGQWTGTAYEAGIATENWAPPMAGTYRAIAYELTAAQVAARDWKAAQPSSVETVQVVGPGENQGRVAFSAAWESPVPAEPGAQVWSVQASAPAVTDARYQFWLLRPGMGWVSSGAFTSSPVFQFVVANSAQAAGDEVVVYALPAGEAPTAATAPQWERPLSAAEPFLAIAPLAAGGAQ
jgi:hypothetical protein